MAKERVYDIIGRCNGKKEVIDTAIGQLEAEKLVEKYKTAYGPNWKIWYE